MSDLISRSALIEALIKCDGLGRKSCELVAKVIMNQPCAYDVDAVVKELEEARNESRAVWNSIDDESAFGESCGLGLAIEIVRKGGVE